jgi:hypothetical protein
VDCLAMETETLCSFETPVTVYQATQCNDQKSLDLQYRSSRIQMLLIAVFNGI